MNSQRRQEEKAGTVLKRGCLFFEKISNVSENIERLRFEICWKNCQE